MFLNDFFDLLGGIGGTGKKEMICENDVGKGLCIFRYFYDIYNTGNVDTALANNKNLKIAIARIEESQA
jgi:hypothetical protein